MPNRAAAELQPEAACDRCGESLNETQQSRLSVTHEGAGTERYVDVDRRVCVDCVAALGLLEFEAAATGEDQEAGKQLRDRFSPLRSRTR